MHDDADTRWAPMPVEAGQTVHWRIGPLTLWLRRTEQEWHVAAHRAAEADTADAAADGPDDSLDWKRWAAGEEARVVVLTPRMPDRSVVARPESAIQIPPGRHALFYVSVPIWVQVAVGEGEATALCEVPTVLLSNTWFGDAMSGELCYSLQTRARRRVEEGEARAHRIVVPVRLHNAHTEPLAFERLCIRVEHLTLYDGRPQMWTNGVSVRFRGDDKPSLVEYDPGPTAVVEAGEAIGEARTPPSTGLLKRSFATLSSFASGFEL